MVISTHLWLLKCSENYGFVQIKVAFYNLFFCLNRCICFTHGLLPFWTQLWINFLALLFRVPIHIPMFAMPIRIPPFLSCGFHILVSFLANFLLAHVSFPLLGVQLNLESFVSSLIYVFHTMKLQLSLDMAEESTKILHHHS
jgi:hypothetical protein